MTDIHNNADPDVSPSVERRIDRLCDEYERAWASDQLPDIKTYLGRMVESCRPRLLGELVALEVELRRGAGEMPHLEDYYERFPEDTNTIDDAFRLAPHRSCEAVAETADFGTSEAVTPADHSPTPPKRIGPYVVKEVLGRGGFGWVYLGHDPELDRLVALKSPRMDRFSSEEDIERFVEEARTLGQLSHPGIIAVYGVHREGDAVYIVEEYIAGQNLASLVKAGPLSQERAVGLLFKIAEAADYAVHQGLVHRDLKPANVLIDEQGMPHLADFGLAIHETLLWQRKGEVAGSPAYMSPEQVRGETHRLDGRSDIWSMGVMLYEMLVGRRPFHGESRKELFEEIRSHHPKPLRQTDPDIPRELERICLKCVSKKMSERYATAGDLAEDLRYWLETRDAEQSSSEEHLSEAGTPDVANGPSPGDSSARIVPKGLRSFDADDADFFLELLPGPRDRNGLPEGIRFWKRRLEEMDPDETSPIAILYGPSGCGKSSLVKAGLMPRLAGYVVPVYVEATADDTEVRLLKGLRKQCPALPHDVSLPEMFELLREEERLPSGRKVLVIFDQFEQWLHANRASLDTQLVDALRHCDGRRIQCLILVRDDFWLAISRFMDTLEVPLVEGANSALVDLFDPFHAGKVLAEFGQSFGRLPEDLAKEQKDFLGQAVEELAVDGKVVPIRLALFAEMVKGKAWTPKTLHKVGGAAGIGVAFLDETFSSQTAPPEHRLHQRAARACLKTLLPGKGSVILGHMRSRQQLLEASGYQRRPERFDALVRILDGEVRLITPTQPDGSEFTDEDNSPTVSDGAYYQLTHDYLIPVLRDWLMRKQRETRRGRAELLLAERVDLWNVKQERRQLPSWWEWLSIRTFGRKRDWTDPQRRMMRAARRFHLTRAFFALALVLVLLFAGFEIRGRFRAKALVDQLLSAETAEVPQIVSGISSFKRWAAPLLEEQLDERRADQQKASRVRLALLPSDAEQTDYLVKHLLVSSPLEVKIIRDGLLPHRVRVTGNLWAALADAEQPNLNRLRAACALATLDPGNERWPDYAERVAGWLVSDTALTLEDWAKLLRPVRERLIPPLETTYRKSQDLQLRKTAALVLSDYLSDDTDRLVTLIKEAQPDQLRAITGNLSAHGEQIVSGLMWELDQPERDLTDGKRSDAARANVVVALMRLGHIERTWPLLEFREDPTLRSYLIRRIAMSGVDANVLLKRLRAEPEALELRGILLSLGQYDAASLPKRVRGELIQYALKAFRNDADAGVHSAAEWLLRHYGADQELDGAWKKWKQTSPDGENQWYVTAEGHTMVLVDGPVDFAMGSPETEGGRDYDERLHRAQTDGPFVISAKEVTIQQFLRFQEDYAIQHDSPTATCPVNSISRYQALAYCNWLSEREGLPKDQWCYHFESGRLRAVSGALSRTGYRLPTETEWEYACRADTTTSRFFGEAPDLIQSYCWGRFNSDMHYHSVAMLMPNDFGLFDMHGNVAEWCHDLYIEDLHTDPLDPPPGELFVYRGGSAGSRESELRSASRRGIPSGTPASFMGFRITRSSR